MMTSKSPFQINWPLSRGLTKAIDNLKWKIWVGIYIANPVYFFGSMQNDPNKLVNKVPSKLKQWFNVLHDFGFSNF